MLTEHAHLAWQFFIQDYATAHQRLTRWTQGVLLLFILTLSQTSENIQHYLQYNLQDLLGADAVITQHQALTKDQLTALAGIVDEVVISQQLQATLSHNGLWQVSKIKAVASGYPLQGDLLTANSVEGRGEQSAAGPLVGEIWMDTRLLASLSLNIGDHLSVAKHKFLVSKVLVHEPDRLMEGHTVQQRAMINTKDLEKFNVSSSSTSYRYLIGASDAQLQMLIDWQQQVLPAADIYHKRGAHPLALFWKRTENVIGLASIILFFMAAIAIEQLSQVFVKKERFFSAVCMSLGASNTSGVLVSIGKWFLSYFTLLPLIALLSVAFQMLIIHWLQDSFVGLEWRWSAGIAAKSIGFVTLVFLVFHLPVWLSLRKSSVGELFSDRGNNASHWLNKSASIAVLFIIAFAYSDNGLLTAMMMAAILIVLVLMVLMSWVTLTLGEKLTHHQSGLISFALFMMKQRIASKSTQIIGIGLSAFLLLFTLMLLRDLGNTMVSYQRQHDGNVIVSQATNEQFSFIKEKADELNIDIRQTKPYVYGKLIAVNQLPLKAFAQQPSESMATLSKAIRMHWNDALPNNNQLIEGKWWSPESSRWQQVSIEQEVMTDLGLAIGDRLTFFIGSESHEFEITASHAFKSGHGSITFWVQMPVGALDVIQAPHYVMSSLELSDEQWPLMGTLWKKFPTLRMTSLDTITERFDRILAMITQVISGFSLLIIALATIVVFSSVNAQEPKEKLKNSIIMSFGLNKDICLKLNLIEWIATAAITATGAILGTYFAGLMIYQSQFSLVYTPDIRWLLLTTVAIVSFVTCLGVAASRNTLRYSVRQLLSDDSM